MKNRDIFRESGDIYYHSRSCDYIIYCGDKNGSITYRTFLGTSKCHPKDTFDPSTGLKLAELRAKKKYIKWLIQEVKEDRKAIENVYKAMSCFKNFNPKSTEAYAVRRQIKAFDETIDAYKITISVINEQMNRITS